MRQLSLVGFRWRRKHRCNSGAYRGTHRHTVTWSACNSSTSRYDKEKRKYHTTANRMTSGSNCRHLNKPQTKDARRSVQLPYHRMTAKLQHFPFGFCGLCREAERRVYAYGEKKQFAVRLTRCLSFGCFSFSNSSECRNSRISSLILRRWNHG